MDTILQNPALQALIQPFIITMVIIAVFPLMAGYIVLVERKVLADMQVRLGPMRVGPHGLLQPIADALKLMLKEDIIPSASDKSIFWLAPVISTFTGLTAFAVIPFSQQLRVADVNIGLLVISAMSSVGIMGIVLGGWASNSKYALMGALRSAAQLVSYEVALALALVAGVMSAGTLSMVKIVTEQQTRGVWFAFDNFGLMFAPFMVYLIAATAETNRAPFDLPENIFVVSSVAVTLFWGGWLRPFPNIGPLEVPLNIIFPVVLFAGSGLGCFKLIPKLKDPIQGKVLTGVAVLLIGLGALFLVPFINALVIDVFWFLIKVSVIIYIMIWFRGTFPRFRYDQLMDIGWKWLIPIGLIAIAVNAVVGMLRLG